MVKKAKCSGWRIAGLTSVGLPRLAVETASSVTKIGKYSEDRFPSATGKVHREKDGRPEITFRHGSNRAVD